MIKVTTIGHVNDTKEYALWTMNKANQTAIIITADEYEKFTKDATYNPKFETIGLNDIKVMGIKNERNKKIELHNYPFSKISSPVHYFKCK